MLNIKELEEMGYTKENVETYLNLFEEVNWKRWEKRQDFLM